MYIHEMDRHMRTLAQMGTSSGLVVSCYVDLRPGSPKVLNELEERAMRLRRGLDKIDQAGFDWSMRLVCYHLCKGMRNGTLGAALFGRGGEDPFFLPLQFRVPMQDWLGVGQEANIYPLVELRSRYGRYLAAHCTQASIRILEVHLSSPVVQATIDRADLRQPTGRGWTIEHLRSHIRERTNQMVRQAASVLQQQVFQRDPEHLVLAGQPRITSLLIQEPPMRLFGRVADRIAMSRRATIAEIVEATQRAALDAHRRESHAAVGRLQRELIRSGVAVAGSYHSSRALREGRASTLLLACEHDPLDRAHLVRLAVQHGCAITLVEGSDLLLSLGGVGCLLRCQVPQHQVPDGVKHA